MFETVGFVQDVFMRKKTGAKIIVKSTSDISWTRLHDCVASEGFYFEINTHTVFYSY